VRTLGADYADAALFQKMEELRHARLLPRNGPKIDHDGACVEEIGRPFHLRIKGAEPVFQRHLGRQNQRHDGAAT
jgi:hypothetical protein